MIWVITGVGILFLIVHMQIRIYLAEKIRISCIDLAMVNRHSEPVDDILRRAEKFEKFVRGIKEEPSPPTRSPRK